MPRHGTPQRVLVAGASGVGKTTFGRALADTWALPYTELDALHWADGWQSRPGFLDQVTTLVTGDAWITEYQYSSARPLLIARAQLVVHLDYPRALVTWRVTRRTLRRWRSQERLWGTDNTEPPLRTFFTNPDHIIRWSWKGIARYRAEIDAVRAEHPEVTVVVLRSPAEAASWLADAAQGWQESVGR